MLSRKEKQKAKTILEWVEFCGLFYRSDKFWESNEELKHHLNEVSYIINEHGIAGLAFNRENHTGIFITEEFINKCKKGKIWNTPHMLSSIKNCWYGVNLKKLKSSGGRDGIFEIDRDYRPKNEMQRKISDQYIDKETSRVNDVCRFLGCNKEDIRAVRIVSHHMRIVGILSICPWIGKDLVPVKQSRIVLVDYDINEH